MVYKMSKRKFRPRKKLPKDKLEYFLRTNGIEIIDKQFNEDVSIRIKVNEKSLALLQDSFSYTVKLLKI